MAFTPDDQEIYVTGSDNASIDVYSTLTKAEIGSFPIGTAGEIDSVMMNAAGDQLYVYSTGPYNSSLLEIYAIPEPSTLGLALLALFATLSLKMRAFVRLQLNRWQVG